jgi:hypothetical protein
MAEVLENLARVNDVRDYIKEIVYMNQINFHRAKEIFSEINTNTHNIEVVKENDRYNKISNTGGVVGKSKEEIQKKNKLKILSVEVTKNIHVNNSATNDEDKKNLNSQNVKTTMNKSHQNFNNKTNNGVNVSLLNANKSKIRNSSKNLIDKNNSKAFKTEEQNKNELNNTNTENNRGKIYLITI